MARERVASPCKANIALKRKIFVPGCQGIDCSAFALLRFSLLCIACSASAGVIFDPRSTPTLMTGRSSSTVLQDMAWVAVRWPCSAVWAAASTPRPVNLVSKRGWNSNEVDWIQLAYFLLITFSDGSPYLTLSPCTDFAAFRLTCCDHKMSCSSLGKSSTASR